MVKYIYVSSEGGDLGYIIKELWGIYRNINKSSNKIIMSINNSSNNICHHHQASIKKWSFELLILTNDSNITLQLCSLMNHNSWDNAYY